MAGICGVFGRTEHTVDVMSEILYYNGNEKRCKYDDNHLSLENVFLPKAYEEQPTLTKNKMQIWIWGNIHGIQKGDHHKPKDREESNSQLFSKLYNRYELEFLKELNGEFAGVIYDEKNKKIHLVTDRLSTHPIFYTKTKEGDLVFSTQIQCLPLYPSVETSFEMKYLYQFLIFERVLGVKTPLKGIEKVHPGAVLTYDFNSGDIKQEIYWTPRYQPKNRPFREIQNEFIAIFKDIINERIREDLRYGLYISGGRDSRLILAAIKDVFPDLEVTCFHMNEFMNREAKISKEVADACGCEFVLLKRELDYQSKVLEYSSPISIYSSWFDQAHGIGFKDDIRKKVDVIFNGSGANTILEMGQVPKKSIKIPIVNQNFYVNKPHIFKDINEFTEYYLDAYGSLSGRKHKIPKYLKRLERSDLKKILLSEYKEGASHFEYHGVKYPTLYDFIHSYKMYPITNMYSYLTYYADNQYILTEYPFLDNRLIDFSLILVDDYKKKKQIISSTIQKLNPDLGNIKHANTGLPLKYPSRIHFIKGQYNMAMSKLFPSRKKEGSWGNMSEVLRKHDFVKDVIYENEDLIKKCTFLEWDKVIECYKDHLDGKNNEDQLIALLTFLRNPITKYIMSSIL